MAAGVTPIMVGVTRRMDGAIPPMDGVIPTTDMGPTGLVITVVIGMDIIMEEADMDTITPHLITPIQKEAGATGMVTASQGQVFRDMVPGA
jgi:hypothetical protein